jgi:putative spermidine/putrescine transport system ATP-binding protein
MCLLGPSGCGKTTTLNVVAGFVFPDGGGVYLDGRPITDVPANRRRMGMVFQNYALFPHLSVEKNVTFGLEMRRVGRSVRKGAARRMLEVVGLQGYEDRRPARLSGGQQQRVALARALVVEPAVLLLDEPFSNLDARLRVQLRDQVRAIQRRLDITTIFVTHDQEEALSISDRVALMRDGRIEQLGRPEDVYLHPRSLFAARFLGEINELAGRVVESRDMRCIVDVPGVGRIGGCPVGGPHREGERVVACVRPEAMGLTRPGGAMPEAGGSIDGRVLRRAFLGSRVTYRVATEVGELNIGGQGTTETYADGAAVTVTWDATDVTVIAPSQKERGDDLNGGADD